jgi:membrane protease subunit HflK
MQAQMNKDIFDDISARIKPDKLLKKFVLLGGVLLIMSLGKSAIYTVQPEGKSVVKRFGKVVSIKEPGLHFKIPFMDQQYFVPTERVLKEEFGFRTKLAGQRTKYESKAYGEESLMLTGDLNVINVEWVLQYRIDDPNKFLHRVKDQRASIRDVSEAVMRRIVGNRIGSDVLTVGRVEIAALARIEMQKVFDSYDMGVHLSTIQLQDVTPPESVKPAFNSVNESRQEKERSINEAEKRRNQEVPKAQGEAQQIIAEAQGYAAERINLAKGEASRFKAIQTEYSQAPEVTRQRLYIEAMDKVISQVNKVYVVEEGGLMPIPLLNLQENASEPVKKERSKR